MTTKRHTPPAHIGQTPMARTIEHCKAIAGRHRTIATNRPLTLKDVKGPLRWREIVKARAEVACFLRHERNWSFPRIGEFLGGRDHTTIMNLTSSTCRAKKRAVWDAQKEKRSNDTGQKAMEAEIQEPAGAHRGGVLREQERTCGLAGA